MKVWMVVIIAIVAVAVGYIIGQKTSKKSLIKNGSPSGRQSGTRKCVEYNTEGKCTNWENISKA